MWLLMLRFDQSKSALESNRLSPMHKLFRIWAIADTAPDAASSVSLEQSINCKVDKEKQIGTKLMYRSMNNTRRKLTPRYGKTAAHDSEWHRQQHMTAACTGRMRIVTYEWSLWSETAQQRWHWYELCHPITTLTEAVWCTKQLW